MPRDISTDSLIINRLTRAQYNSIADPSPTELYVITDEDGTIGSLSDVSINNAANGEVLQYNSTSQKWENVILSTNVSSLSDVSLTNLSNGQALRYNSTSQKWENSTLSDEFVRKSGDTMTGILNINRASGNNYIQVRVGDLDFTAPPTSVRTLAPFQLSDKNDKWIGKMQVQYKTDGGHAMEFSVRKSATEERYSKMTVGWNGSGQAYSEFAPTVCCDGQWITTNTTIISTATSLAASTTKQYTLSFLPSDGKTYEVMFSIVGTTGTTLGDTAQIGFGSIVNVISNICATGVCQVEGVADVWAASLIIPVGTNRIINIRQNSDKACTCTSLKAVAYRRVGTNT